MSRNSYCMRLLAVLSDPTKSTECDQLAKYYPFPDINSSGCLEAYQPVLFKHLLFQEKIPVHTLSNPEVEEIKKSIDSFRPELLYLQGEQLPNEEVGPMVYGGVPLSTPEAVCRLFGATWWPTTVYLETPNGEDIAKALFSKGIPNVIYLVKTVTRFVACHFRQALFSVLQSLCCDPWDAFMLAYASSRAHCLKDDDERGPCFLGNHPKINVQHCETAAGDDNQGSHIEILDPEVSLRFLVCGFRCGLDSSFLQSLASGLSVLLGIEIRGSKLRIDVSKMPPPPRGVVTTKCYIHSCSALSWLSVSGSSQTCSNEQLLESLVKRELIEKRHLVSGDLEKTNKRLSDARRAAAIADIAPVFEVYMKGPKWASEVLKHVARDCSRRELVALGIASVEGIAVASFENDDAQRILFFCDRQEEEEESCSIEFPSWLKPPAPRRNGSDVVPMKRKTSAALRPVPHVRPFRKFKDYFSNHTSNDVANGKSTEGSSQAQQPVRLRSVKMKKHECGRSPIQVCSEEEFLKDLMHFLALKGRTNLIPRCGFSEFPKTIFHKKRLDLYNMYKEVVSLGGFRCGHGINWRRNVFPKMRNYVITNSGLRSALRRHYETYLLEYELAHDDVDVNGKLCLFCHRCTAGDWVKCKTCREWAHYGCDERPNKSAFKLYDKGERKYACPQCTIPNHMNKIHNGKYASST